MSTAETTAVALAAVVVGIIAALRTARHRGPDRTRRGPMDWGDVLPPFVAAGLVLAFAAIGVVLSQPRWLFGVGHIVYLGLTVTLPGIAILVLATVVRRRGSWGAAVLAVILLVPAPIGWYATHVEPFHLRVDRVVVDLPAARAGHRSIRLAVVSDIQTTRVGSYEQRAVRLLLAQRPDIIVIAGDLFQGNDAQFRAALPGFRALLSTLHAPGGVYAVQGDSEPESELHDLTAGTGIQVLDDQLAMVQVGDRQVAVGGNRLRWAPPEGVALRDRLIALDPSVVRVLVAHRPEVVENLGERSGIDLVAAGHTHGGQVALPLIGPLFTFSPVARKVAAGGLHEVRGNPIYVSTGIGMVRGQAPQVRFRVRPSFGIVTLR